MTTPIDSLATQAGILAARALEGLMNGDQVQDAESVARIVESHAMFERYRRQLERTLSRAIPGRFAFTLLPVHGNRPACRVYTTIGRYEKALPVVEALYPPDRFTIISTDWIPAHG